ncbi:MAG: hypothetical protein ACE5ID_11440 [Acidobacteriota bacterium]
MKTHAPSSQPGPLNLESASDVPPFLGEFFRAGRSAAGRPIIITEGLWTLLWWGWSLGRRERQMSALCRKLLVEPGMGWRDEGDVVEAMARGTHQHNPSRLTPGEVQPFAEALLEEGEAVRGSSRLVVHLEFLLPRAISNPNFSPSHIKSALRKKGASESLLHDHFTAVHAELAPYRGRWVMALGDGPEAGDGLSAAGTVCREITLRRPRVGGCSHLSLHLEHRPQLAGYFDLSLSRNAANGCRWFTPASQKVGG